MAAGPQAEGGSKEVEGGGAFHSLILQELCLGLQDPASKPIAAEDLRRYAPIYANDMLRDTKVLQLLGGLIREAPDSPAACSAMLALSTLTMPPAGRARVCGVSGVIGPLIRFLASTRVTSLNAEPATQLLAHLAADRGARTAIRKAGGITALASLLQQGPQGRMADVLAGALVNLVLVEEGEGRAAFAAAGGIEVACALLHARGRQDSSVAGWRLRLLLADLANDSRYDVQVRQAAGSLSMAASMYPTPRLGAAAAAAADDAVAAAAAADGAAEENVQ